MKTNLRIVYSSEFWRRCDVNKAAKKQWEGDILLPLKSRMSPVSALLLF
jgi:hypothetical protein